MYRNAPQTAHADMVKGMLPFESGKYPFNRRALSVQGLPFRSSHLDSVQGIECPIGLRKVNDWAGAVLPFNQAEHGLASVTFISHHELWVELPVRKPCVAQNVRGSFVVVDVPLADVYADGHFRLGIYEQMEFPPIGVLLFTVRASLNRPSSLSVNALTVIPIRPCLERGGIERNALTERWQGHEVSPYQITRDFFNQRLIGSSGNPVEETAQGGFVGYLGHVVDSAHLSDSWAILESTNQSSSRRYAQDEPRENATPEDFDGIAFWTASHFTSESVQEWCVIDVAEDPFQLENGRYFDNASNGVMMMVCHRKGATFLWLEGVGADYTYALAFLNSFYERFSYKYYPIFRRQNLHFFGQFSASFYEGVSYEL